MASMWNEDETSPLQQLRQLDTDSRWQRITIPVQDERGRRKGTQLLAPIIPLAPQTCRDRSAGGTHRLRRREVGSEPGIREVRWVARARVLAMHGGVGLLERGRIYNSA